MTVRIKNITFDCVDPFALVGFWSQVTGFREDPDNGNEPGDPEGVLLAPDKSLALLFVAVPESKTVKNRVHLDLVRSSVQPLVDAGATVVHEPSPDWQWHVLTDPEGNEFCVFEPKPDEPSALVVDAVDEERIAAWWADALGATLSPGPEGIKRWLRDVPGLPWDVWKFVAVPEPKAVKNRWHWDVVCDDVPALVARGASVLREPDDDAGWHVLADPEGNEFCASKSPRGNA